MYARQQRLGPVLRTSNARSTGTTWSGSGPLRTPPTSRRRWPRTAVTSYSSTEPEPDAGRARRSESRRARTRSGPCEPTAQQLAEGAVRRGAVMRGRVARRPSRRVSSAHARRRLGVLCCVATSYGGRTRCTAPSRSSTGCVIATSVNPTTTGRVSRIDEARRRRPASAVGRCAVPRRRPTRRGQGAMVEACRVTPGRARSACRSCPSGGRTPPSCPASRAGAPCRSAWRRRRPSAPSAAAQSSTR